MKRSKWLSLWKPILVGGMMTMFLFGCFGAKYQVDYCGSKDLFKGAKDAYRAGQTVKITYPYVATDTDYKLLLDGEPLSYEYDQNKGFVITFTMPAHNITLEMESRNSMISPYDSESDYTREFGMDNLAMIATGTELLRHYYSVISPDGECDELVLIAVDDVDQLQLDHYYKENANAELVKTSYLIPAEILQDICTILHEGALADWPEEGICLDGVRKECRFYKYGDYISVSVEALPDEQAETYLDSIGAVLRGYMKDEYRME